MTIKLTKNELRSQEGRLKQLNRYLPTLELKKQLLQLEVNKAQEEMDQLQKLFLDKKKDIEKSIAVYSDRDLTPIIGNTTITNAVVAFENIAGIDVPNLTTVEFLDVHYDLFQYPLWIDNAIEATKQLKILQEKVKIAKKKKDILEKELRDVSVKVNLFEKILIPRAIGNIRKIKIFLGDQQIMAVGQAKVALKKIRIRRNKTAC